jgi:hypothetical protein
MLPYSGCYVGVRGGERVEGLNTGCLAGVLQD